MGWATGSRNSDDALCAYCDPFHGTEDRGRFPFDELPAGCAEVPSMTGSVAGHGGRALRKSTGFCLAGAVGARNPKHMHFTDDLLQGGGTIMNTRSTLVTAALLTALAVPAWGQTAGPAAAPAKAGAQGAASIP